MEQDRERRRIPSGPPVWRYATLGTELAGGLVGFVLLGWAIDRQLGSSPIAVVTTAILGCIGGMVHLIRRAMQMQQETQRSARPRDEQAHPQNNETHRTDDDEQR